MLQHGIAELRASLTAILGQAQLLRRRIPQGSIHDSDACLESLACIEVAALALEVRLRDLETQAQPVTSVEPMGHP